MEPGHELSSANHDHHPLEWRSSDACLLCLLTTIQDGSASGGPALTIHRRFALSFLIQRLGIDAGVVASPKQLAAHSSLIQLLQRSHHVTAKVLIGLLNVLQSNDVVDLAIEAIYRLYHSLRDEVLLESILTHCLQTLSDHILGDTEKWPPFLSLLQRFARLDPVAVGRKLHQYRSLEKTLTERLTQFSELVAFHVVSFLGLVLRNGQVQIHTGSRRNFVIELAELLKRCESKHVQKAVLDTIHVSLISECLDATDGVQLNEVHLALVSALKKIILQSLPEMQMAAMEVLEVLLWKQSQTEDGVAVIELVLEQDMAELIYEVLYSNHHAALLECALRCLHHLSRCPLFFQNRCVILGLEPILRVTPHLLQNGADRLVVASSVQILSDMLVKYQGDDPLLLLLSSTQNAFNAATGVAVAALSDATLQLKISGAHLIAALLHVRYLGLPLPLATVRRLVDTVIQHLAPDSKNGKAATSQYQSSALIAVLSAIVRLIADHAGQPTSVLASYAAQAPAVAGDSFDLFVEFFIGKIDLLMAQWCREQETDAAVDSPWPNLLQLLLQLAASGEPGSLLFEKWLRCDLLERCFQLRRESTLKAAVDDVLSWFLGRLLLNRAPLPSSPFVTIKELVQQIPSRMQQLSTWLARDKQAPLAAKTLALILVYNLEMARVTRVEPRPGPVLTDQAEPILDALGRLLIATPPSGLDHPPLLQSIWFLIARYGGEQPNEASRALVHLIRWLQPDRHHLVPWLRQIYTHDVCLLRWAFAEDDVALHLGPAVVRLWTEGAGEGASKVILQISTQTSGDVLLLSLFDLIFDADDQLSCLMSEILEEIARAGRPMCTRLGKLIKRNLPRLLLWTDVQAGVIQNQDNGRLVGVLRLLVRLTRGDNIGSVTWAEPTVVSSVVSFLSRTANPPTPSGQEYLQPSVTTIDLWTWGCRYLGALITAVGSGDNARAVVGILMDNQPFLRYLNQLLEQEELPTWEDAVQLVAAMAALQHQPLIEPSGTGSVRLSTTNLTKKLAQKLAGAPTDRAAAVAVVRLLDYLLRNDFGAGWLADPELVVHLNATAAAAADDEAGGGHRKRPCRDLEDTLQRLWLLLLNLSLRADPSTAGTLFGCLIQLVAFCRRRTSAAVVTRLLTQPWNYLALLHAIDCGTEPQACATWAPCSAVLEFADDVVRHDQQVHSSATGRHSWALQLESVLQRIPQQHKDGVMATQSDTLHTVKN